MANKHIHDLNAAVRSFLDSKPYKVATKRNPDTRQLIYYVASAEPIPTSFATITGDVLNNLRSSLDHLAQQLYLVGTESANGYRDKTSFPIAETAKKFKAGLLGKVQGMKQDACNAICALEPYQGGQGADLWPFHRLNNIDKHRLIVSVGSALVGVGVSFPMVQMLPKISIRPANILFPLKAGDEIFVDFPDAEWDENQDFTFQIVIYEPGVIEGKPLVKTLV